MSEVLLAKSVQRNKQVCIRIYYLSDKVFTEIRLPLQETDIPPHPMAKLSLDLSGRWPEAFAVPDRTADTVADLNIEQIYPRFGCLLQVVSDIGTENVNKVMKETLAKLKIDHVLTSVYHPQSIAKVEKFRRTLHEALSKKIADNQQTLDLFLN